MTDPVAAEIVRAAHELGLKSVQRAATGLRFQVEGLKGVYRDGEFDVALLAWQVPQLWKLIQEKGNISTEEMYRVFNMGIGMIIIVDKSIASDIQSSISEPTFIIGELTNGEQKVILA